MATGPLRFRTPHIEELPTVQTKQAPGFAWVAVSGPTDDPSKNWGTTNRKRARNAASGLQTDSQREALSARQQREIDRRIRDLNSDGTRDVLIPATGKKESGAARAGKTPNTKKILASGKTFAHYLDDEEAELARNGGRREADLDLHHHHHQPVAAAVAATAASTQRASKTPIARRKTLPREGSAVSGSPAPSVPPGAAASSSLSAILASFPTAEDDPMDVDDVDNNNDNDNNNDPDSADLPIAPLPSRAEMEALLSAPPLTYNQARSAPPPPGAPPPRRFCEICGYWGRVKCMKCGNMTCSVACKDAHDEHRCLKFYA